jgi:sugar O-acyltransferase (sialic acid O-acetyltransferase NeuD family)
MDKHLHATGRNPGGKTIFGLYGAGGFAREVMPLAVEHVARAAGDVPGGGFEIFLIETEVRQAEVNGYRVVSEDEFFDVDCGERLFNVAIGDSRARATIAQRCIDRGASPMSLRSNHSIVYDRNEIGEGAVLCANTMVTSNAKIGRFFHANIFSYVAHDCVIGDYVTFAPGVHCNGNVHVRDHAYIGTGAILKQGSRDKPLVVGEGAVVGMGAVVTKDVPAFTTVVGNPARPFVKG